MDDSPWSRARSEIYALFGRNPRSNRDITRIAELDESHAVLDVGCGPGAAVRTAAGMVSRAVGVDRSAAMVGIARRRSLRFDNVEFIVGGAEELPFPDESFDRVWTIHSFHHWEDRRQGLVEAMRVLRPGGRLLIVESESSGPHGLDSSRADALSRELRSIGFDTADVTTPHRELVVTGVRRGSNPPPHATIQP